MGVSVLLISQQARKGVCVRTSIRVSRTHPGRTAVVLTMFSIC